MADRQGRDRAGAVGEDGQPPAAVLAEDHGVAVRRLAAGEEDGVGGGVVADPRQGALVGGGGDDAVRLDDIALAIAEDGGEGDGCRDANGRRGAAGPLPG